MKYNFKEALILFRKGHLNKAKHICLEVLKKTPSNFDTLYLTGLIAFQEKKYNESDHFINKAIKINPSIAEAHNIHGIVFVKLEKFNLALKSFDAAIKINPNYVEAYNNKGNLFLELNEMDTAVESFKKAIEIKPDYDDAYYNLGNALSKLRKLKAAVENYKNAIKINPNRSDVYNNLGNTLRELKQIDASYLNYKEAYKIDPEKDFLFDTLIHLRSHLCDWSSISIDKNFLRNKILKERKITMPFIITTSFDSPSLQKISAEIYVKDKVSKIKLLGPIKKNKKNKKIRLGYYSADFREHSTPNLANRLFELHDKSKFEVFGFSFIPTNEDKIFKRIENAFDNMIDVKKKSNLEIAQLSRDLNIDIAIDLMGFTTHNKFEIFAHKCAPIQINFLGYPGTSGASFIDYIVADKVLIPKENQKYFSEKIIYLPNSYQPNDSKKKISNKVFKREELNLPKNSFVFCCFNQLYKITPNVFDIWMRLLKNVKNSVLLLLEDNQTGALNLKQEAELRGIKSERIIFVNRMPLPEHLARHKLADLFIDTFPCTAHTTCSDALWAGLPVLTRIGESFVSRVPASLLSSIGLSELITKSDKEYENLALELATNPIKLKKIKKKLENSRFIKPLFDSKLYTYNIELAYSKIYENYIQNKKPKNIEIK